MSEKTTLGENGIYDARSLGVPKMLLLGLQHMFAMFGATILVPMLTGLDVSTTLLFAGLGTLLFHLLTKRKVPAFLGSSFAFLGGYAAIAPIRRCGQFRIASLCLLRRGLLRSAVSGIIPVDQDLRYRQGNAFLPAHRNRPHHHCHRSDPVPVRYQQLFRRLADRSGRYCTGSDLQYLG